MPLITSASQPSLAATSAEIIPVSLMGHFTDALPLAVAEDLASRAVVIDRCFFNATHAGVFDLWHS